MLCCGTGQFHNGVSTTLKDSSTINANLHGLAEIARVRKQEWPFMRSQVLLIGVTVLI